MHLSHGRITHTNFTDVVLRWRLSSHFVFETHISAPLCNAGRWISPPPPLPSPTLSLSSERTSERSAVQRWPTIFCAADLCVLVFSAHRKCYDPMNQKCVSRCATPPQLENRPGPCEMRPAPTSEVQLAASGVRSRVASRRGPIGRAHPPGAPQGTSAHLCTRNYGQCCCCCFVSVPVKHVKTEKEF